MITARQALPAEVQLPRNPWRHRHQAGIEDIGAQVGDRQADWHAVAVFVDTGPVGDVDGRFGRPVQIVEPRLRQLGEHLLLGIERQRLATADDTLQATAGLDARFMNEGLEHRRHEMQGADVEALDGRDQAGRFTVLTRRRQGQACAGQQRPEELPHRDVEAERGLLQDRVAGIEGIGLLHPQQAIDQRRMAVARALGTAGGTGGVDDIGQLLRVDRHGRVAVGKALPVQAVERQNAYRLQRQALKQCRLRQYQRHATVFDHIGQALGRIIRIERHIGGAGLEDRQQTDDHLQRTLHGDTDQAVRPDALGQQLVGQAVGAQVQFAVAQLLLGKQQRRGFGRALDLGFDQLVQGLLQRVVDAGVVPVDNPLLVLGRRQHRQLLQALLRISEHAAQQRQPMAAHALDGAGVEQVSGIGQCRT
ncbi:hypothetical protein D3C78_430100 [compost metagenome]